MISEEQRADSVAASKRIFDLEQMLGRSLHQLQAWHRIYGEQQPDWLPPSGDVVVLEDADELMSSNAGGNSPPRD